jgi:nucleoside-diphosphate-sugar epimerase
MRVLVTGGSDFIGRNLIERLARTHEVLAPTHTELDLADPGALDRWFLEPRGIHGRRLASADRHEVRPS